MGCSNSIQSSDLESNRIDEELRKERKLLRNEVKLLLLGAGESGKSTVVKQMRLLYSEPLTIEQRERYTSVVCSNTLQSMQVVLHGTQQLQIPLPAHLIQLAQLILSVDPLSFESISQNIPSPTFSPEITRALIILYKDPVVKSIILKGNELQLNDSAVYFFENLIRIGNEEGEGEDKYIPSEQDILRTRVRSTGIVEEKFIIGNCRLVTIDVGGQRSERKKWIHCFEGVDVVLFVAAISEYDQTLWEDETCNRLNESITVFESIIASRWFLRTSFILFLNKIDIFHTKLQLHPLSTYCPDFNGTTEGDALLYMKERFLMKAERREEIFTHFTCATDSSQCKIVLMAVTNSILKGNLNHVGML